MKTRTLVIGDIHGAYAALNQVIIKAAITSKDKLIFLGDYVDGWSQSKQVIDRLIALSQSHNCIFLRGNHDTWCEEWLKTGKANNTWLFHGGVPTIESYRNSDPEEKQRHLQFFNQMVDYYIDEKNNLFVHAGFCSMHGPHKDICTSNYSWDRTLWELALATDKRIKKDSKLFPKRLKLFNEIFIGHTPTINYNVHEPMNAINVWNIDTGAAFHGRLSIIDSDKKEFWQSDIVQALYPDEKGRNTE